MSELKDYVSKDGTYLIPVTWKVASTFRVRADNLEQALKIAEANLADFPISIESEYVEGSYKIDIDTDNDLLNAQSYHDISDLVINQDGAVE